MEPAADQPEGWRRRGRHLVPFAALMTLTYGLALLPPDAGQATWLLVASAACFGLTALLVVTVPWTRLPAGAVFVPIVAACLGIALLRHYTGGGASGYGGLLLLPVIWQALYGRRFELAGTLVVVAATYIIPIVWIGGTNYPLGQWRVASLSLMIAATVGFVVEHLNRSREELLERARFGALHDELTGLVNRRQMRMLLADALRSPRPAFLALIDLDHFKAYNDRHGHLAGDEALVGAAEAWAAVLGPEATVARWGGEEFVLLLDGGTIGEARQALDRMAGAMSHGLTCSAGLVELREGATASSALSAADELLYAAKALGRDRILTDLPAGARDDAADLLV